MLLRISNDNKIIREKNHSVFYKGKNILIICFYLGKDKKEKTIYYQ
jgi:hypothetical protein